MNIDIMLIRIRQGSIYKIVLSDWKRHNHLTLLVKILCFWELSSSTIKRFYENGKRLFYAL